MPDYSQHKLQNREWCNEYRSRMGKEQYDDFFQKVYSHLLQLPEGKYFDIEKNVTEENRDLFIKICCLFILEQRMSVGDYWVFDENYNRFIHKRHT